MTSRIIIKVSNMTLFDAVSSGISNVACVAPTNPTWLGMAIQQFIVT
jgi:hypothetical protein